MPAIYAYFLLLFKVLYSYNTVMIKPIFLFKFKKIFQHANLKEPKSER